MAKGRVGTTITGYTDTRDKLLEMPEAAREALKQANQEIAGFIAQVAIRNAVLQGHQAALMVPFVKAKKSSVAPSVSVGGTRPVGRNKKPANKLVFGSEWGGRYLKQFKPFNPRGKWFTPAYTNNANVIYARWAKAVDELLVKFGKQDGR